MFKVDELVFVKQAVKRPGKDVGRIMSKTINENQCPEYLVYFENPQSVQWFAESELKRKKEKATK